MNQPIKILLTSAGSRSVEAIVDCLVEMRDKVYLIGTNTTAEFVSLAELDSAYIVPLTNNRSSFKNRLLEIIRAEEPDIIFNGRDEEIEVLSEICEETGALFAGPPCSLATIFSDKYLTYQFSRKHTLPFAETAFTAEELSLLIHKYGFPLVAKPRVGGHASKNVFIISQPKQAENLLQGKNYIFQPFLGGKNLMKQISQWNAGIGIPWIWNPLNTYFMIDFVLDENGSELCLLVSKAGRSGSIVNRLEPYDNESIYNIAHDHIEVLGRYGHAGPVNIQGYIDQKGKFTAFEWNSRFVGSVYGYALLGKNLVLEALNYRFPSKIDLLSSKNKKNIIFRPLVYREVPKDYVQSLKVHGHWKRAENSV